MLVVLGFVGCTGVALAGGGFLAGIRAGRRIERDQPAHQRDGLVALATVHHLPRPRRPIDRRSWGAW